MLTERVWAALSALPRHPRSPAVFVNWETSKRWQDISKPWRRALKEAELPGIWFHDLRRSFVTQARRAGVAESVVMKLSGHRTRSVFDRYNVVSEEDLREAVTLLQARRS